MLCFHDKIYCDLMQWFNCKLCNLLTSVLSNKIKFSLGSSNFSYFYCSKMYCKAPLQLPANGNEFTHDHTKKQFLPKGLTCICNINISYNKRSIHGVCVLIQYCHAKYHNRLICCIYFSPTPNAVLAS